MRVRFLRDYRGPETFEHWHAAGEIVDLPDGEAQALLSAGVVEPEKTQKAHSQKSPWRKGAKS